MKENAAQKLSAVKVTEKPTGYFTPEEFETLLATIPTKFTGNFRGFCVPNSAIVAASRRCTVG